MLVTVYLLPKGAFVFLVLSMLYSNDTLTGFAKAMKTCPAGKQYSP